MRSLFTAVALAMTLSALPARADDPTPAPAAADPTPPAPEPEGRDIPASEAPVHVTARIAPMPGAVAGDMKLAQPQILEIVVTAPKDATLYPPYRPALGSFRVMETLQGSQKIDATTRTETWRFSIIPLRLGVEKIPKIEIPYKLADGGHGQVETPIVRVRIIGFLENDQDPNPGGLPAPAAVIATNWALIWALSIGGALVLAALLTFFVLKAMENRWKALAPAPPPRPANEVALERLDQIDRTSAAELDGGARLAATIDTLRAYLQGRYHIDALEMTTREVVKALVDADLKTIAPSEIQTLLEDTDLVKFARLTPKEEDARATSPAVRRIVTETWEPPKVEVEEIWKLDPASLKQRFYAAGIDLALALALAGVVVGAVVVMGASLAWVGLVIPVVGLVMALRDLGGRSPGKMLLGTTIVRRNDRQPAATLGQRFKRDALYLVWPLTLPLEALVLRKHPLGLRLGDLWAETEVVLAGSGQHLVVPVAVPRPAGADGGAR
ncbi:MAG: RDD family protein [Myxococcota bacterium]